MGLHKLGKLRQRLGAVGKVDWNDIMKRHSRQDPTFTGASQFLTEDGLLHQSTRSTNKPDSHPGLIADIIQAETKTKNIMDSELGRRIFPSGNKVRPESDYTEGLLNYLKESKAVRATSGLNYGYTDNTLTLHTHHPFSDKQLKTINDYVNTKGIQKQDITVSDFSTNQRARKQ